MNGHSHETPGRDLGPVLEDLRKKLVDTTARNRLIHVNRNAKRAKVLNVVDERSDDVYELLRVKERKMRFRARGEDASESGPDSVLLVLDEEMARSKYRDSYLETELGPQTLEKRLLKLYRDSRTTEEEQGANFLFLALGFLRWYEDENSGIPREAPLVLLPVQLTRLQRGFSFNLTARPDDVTSNLPLQERLEGDFGIALPEIDDSKEWTPGDYFDRVEENVAPKGRWSVDRDGMQLGFFSFAKALMFRDLAKKSWPAGGLTGNPLIRGLLDTDREVENAPLRFGPQDRLDEHLDPGDILHVVDADASQAKVIEEARSGRNLVVQGPPGTGKSQTITNIIAAAVHDGKTVLFMAEKMAALKVVHDRLVKVGLRDLCLELHSRTANKKAFYEELGRTLRAGRAMPDTPAEPVKLMDARDKLNKIDGLLHERLVGKDYSPFDVLAELCRFLGELCRFLGEGVPSPGLSSDELAELTNPERDAIKEAVRTFADALKVTGPPSGHPFFGTQALHLQPTDVVRLKQELGRARDAVEALLETAGSIASRLGVEMPLDQAVAERLAQCVEMAELAPEGVGEKAKVLAACTDSGRLTYGLEVFETWKAARDGAKGEFADVAWDSRVEELRLPIAVGCGSVFARWFGKYRGASARLATLLRGKLPRSAEERLRLVDRLLDVQGKRRALAAEEDWLSNVLGPWWRGERTGVKALIEAGKWATDLKEVLRKLGERLTPEAVDAILALASEAPTLRDRLEDARHAVRDGLRTVDERLVLGPQEAVGRPTPLQAKQRRLGRMHDQAARYEEWRRLQEARRMLVQSDQQAFADRMERHGTSAADAESEFLYAVAEARWKFLLSEQRGLDGIRNLDRHEAVAVFQNLDRRRLDEVKALVRSRHLNRLPTGAAGEMGFLRGEIGKKTRHRPVRQAFLAATSVLPRIKPVVLMSPISIAQFLPPGKVSFDLLLIDEASQVRPEDALGAVARARQIVVVGDDKQLPPTSFFNKLLNDEYDDEDDEADAPPVAAGASELESILKLAEARGLGQAMLKWHYRSREPSLIRVSNVEFYESGLVLPPSPLEKDDRFGMALTRVPGVYSSRSRGGGRPGTNRVEAERVADRLVEHARAADSQDQSVGVVAFSKVQSDMITEVLEMRRRKDGSLDALLREGKKEDVFVKNIENVQGDERDVILVSVGYGPHEPNGRLSSMRFGPVNSEGGERRLNVLFSRARMRCEVLVSFDWRDIDLMRTRANGPRVLKRFLEFADTRRLETGPEVTGCGPDSPLEDDVAQVIKGLGYPLDHQVGSAGFRIDLGVRHPARESRYILAVECDGAIYHSALWARERDRLRQQVLEDQGWRFHRIWSTDWYYRREAEIERLREALADAREAAGAGFRPPAANRHGNGRVAVGPRPSGRESQDDAVRAETVAPERPVDEPELLGAPAYECANEKYVGCEALHDVAPVALAGLVIRIVESEGPMHESLVARRTAEAFGLRRSGSRVVRAVRRALVRPVVDGAVKQSGEFFMTPAQAAEPPVRNRSREGGAAGHASNLPPVEIRAAADWIERENGVVQGEEQIRAVARLLGYQRTGNKLKARIAKALEEWP